jgi:hypothetical protein
MRFASSISRLTAAAGCASLLACGPVHSVTVGKRDPGPELPPVVHERPAHGPPPWAPAHGYRHKHAGAYQSRDGTVDLVFDSGLGVYVVVGIPNSYYWNGTYLRIAGDRWMRAPYLDAHWSPCPPDAVPSALRSKSAKAKGKDKGNGAAKKSD